MCCYSNNNDINNFKEEWAHVKDQPKFSVRVRGKVLEESNIENTYDIIEWEDHDSDNTFGCKNNMKYSMY